MTIFEFLRFIAWMMFTAFMAVVNTKVQVSKFAKVFTWFLFLTGSLGMVILLLASAIELFL